VEPLFLSRLPAHHRLATIELKLNHPGKPFSQPSAASAVNAFNNGQAMHDQQLEDGRRLQGPSLSEKSDKLEEGKG
jgi:hypothetical protein